MVSMTLKQCDSCQSPFGPHIRVGEKCDVCPNGRVMLLGVPKVVSASTAVDIRSELAPHPLSSPMSHLLPVRYMGVEHPKLCNKCQHAEEMHSQWGICDVLECEPCCDNMICGVCGHKFGDHWNAKEDVVCLISRCKQSVCYSVDDTDEKPAPQAGEIQLIQRFTGDQYAA